MAESLKLKPDLVERVQALAKKRGRSKHALMVEAVSRYVETEEARDHHKEQALESLAEYRRTGLHLTGEEVSNWLKAFGTRDEYEFPKCHD